MIRLLDIIFSFLSLILLFPLFVLIFFVGFLDTGFPLFIQKRVGSDIKNFTLIKFRTMKIGTLSAGTHLIDKSNITCFGYFIRKFKLDELPQLWNVLMGDMSLVGPRPNLFNQEELIKERDSRGVYSIRPGITGLAQINKIDMSTPKLLAETDAKMIQKLNTIIYFKYIFLTVFGKGFGDRIRND